MSLVRGASAASLVRGIYRFNSTNFTAMHSAGFNSATDGGANAYGAQEAAAGINGMVWLDAYDASACTQTMSDSAITAAVHAAGPSLVFQVGDEPTTNGCAAHDVYAHITSVVHAADATARTWVADDQWMPGGPPNNNPNTGSIPMVGSVDILAFDVYPCQGSCDRSLIQFAAAHIPQQIGSQAWQFIAQDFNAQGWTWPSASDLQNEFNDWLPAFSSAHPPNGYWVFAWDYAGNNLSAQSNFATLEQINATYPGTVPSPTPTASASPSPTATPTPSPSPTASPSPSPSPSPSSFPCNLHYGGVGHPGRCAASSGGTIVFSPT